MTRKQNKQHDRNFDDIAHRFTRNIYEGLKGQIRLAVLDRDLATYLPSTAIHILDAGSGQGQFSLGLAARGHHLTLCDISHEMLKRAQERIDSEKLQNVTLIHAPLQALSDQKETQFDMVICHAVMEWMAEPKTALPHLIQALKPGGILSLTFFNINSIVFKNLLRTNYKK
jgi:S-adenosylmethionine-dependent methyltransferase